MKIFRSSVIAVIFGAGVACATAQAGTVFRNMFAGSEFIWRWDAAPRVHDVEGTLIERSIDGGLRYSLEGGSYQAFRDAFSWQGTAPTLADFTQAVQDAFGVWTTTDPVSGLSTSLSFTEDLGTLVDTTAVGFINFGSEIDVFADDLGDPIRRGFASVFAFGEEVLLTSGVPSYPSFAISGSDIIINSNEGAEYTLEGFKLLLTHELGHALGLADLEVANSEAVFLDDNFDTTSSSAALDTLTNSWARRVNPLDPDNLLQTGLSLYQVPSADPGIATPGVDILMESAGSIELIGETNPMRNDDYGTRQFLYPTVAAPSADFDVDGDVDGDDVDALVAVIAAASHERLFDLTEDTLVDGADLTEWLLLAGQENLNSQNSYLTGDANLDGTVDGADFLLWNQNKFTSLAAWTAGDFNANGTVDGADFLIWNANKFMSAEDNRAVPEPSMAGACVMLVWLFTRYRG